MEGNIVDTTDRISMLPDSIIASNPDSDNKTNSFGFIPLFLVRIVIVILDYGWASMIHGTINGIRADGSKKIKDHCCNPEIKESNRFLIKKVKIRKHKGVDCCLLLCIGMIGTGSVTGHVQIQEKAQCVFKIASNPDSDNKTNSFGFIPLFLVRIVIVILDYGWASMIHGTIDISARIINLEQVEIFGRCLELVIEKGVQVLVIDVYNWDKNLPMFRLPNTLLSASSLTSLTLHTCELPSSLMVGVVKFKSLKLLSLTELPVDEGVIEYLTKSCPILEEIFLKSCYGFKTFCVKRHHNLQKVEIYCRSRLERIDVDAPNIGYFPLENDKTKAPSMSLASCTNLQTFFYHGFPVKSFSDFLSNFPFIETLAIKLSYQITNLNLSNHFLFLRILQLPLDYDLEEVDLNAPNLHFFEYSDRIHSLVPEVEAFSGQE
ncbi:F-box domain, Leucine-rich repeat domain, L domain-like protein [Artemisia annua]|uniref:F-box domain, Leucine-rich repeat domain, L domain-like protein n=1 Tax=Artemisia annua TaxID=35608 RepID=A0A2U1KV96_ARTAN|nr:F-box domain, Leucine-rich repeat domain, L domain-like protein [Artemisia annua]